jgi:flagellar hook protein FlgE
MLQAMFSGVSGLQAHQSEMDVIGNNIANVNTVGYKASTASFEDQLSQTLRAAAGPTSNGTGGQNPLQIGLGVTLGGVNSIQTQGNLQATGKNTDLAVQGQGFFPVTSGNQIFYTRDGSFDLDSTGTIVNPSTGAKLLGYPADAFGNINASAPITSTSTLSVPIGMLTDAKQTSNITFSGNLDASSALYSTKVDYTGSLDPNALSTASNTVTNTIYDSLGNAHSVQTVFTNPTNNPTGTGVPAGSTQSWDVQIKVDSSIIYDSAQGKSKIYKTASGFQFADATGTPQGSSVMLDGGSGINHGPQIPGMNGSSPLTLSMNYGGVTSTAGTLSVNGVSDGQAGSNPVWGTSITAYDSLGVGHLINFTYTRVPLGQNPPPGAATQWNWQATENGATLATSSSGNNTPLFFGTTGSLVNGASQTITVTPTNGAVSPFTVMLNNNSMTQLASDTNAQAASQDGYKVGTLQSFSIDANGVVNGVFSSGQTRALGQIAVASFANPAGLQNAGNNMFQVSDNSGSPQVGVANQSGRGTISPGFLEMSNVDLSTEFTNLIVTQRGFEANTKIISAVDELLQAVINMK